MFTKAMKSKAKLRAAMFGPSGSGKTFSALRVATGMGGKIAVIDTERGSASKYADRFEFDVCELADQTVAGYVAAIGEAKSAGIDVLIIDSLSHAWQQLLEHVDKIANAKYRGNTWSAWSEGTPIQRSLVNALLNFPGHVIATMRTDTEWTQEKDDRTGKARPVKVGLKPQQGKGIEYEFDLLMEITPEHVATVSKDRTGKFQDQIITKPGEDLGKALIAWLNDGAAPAERPAAPAAETGPSPEEQARIAASEQLAKRFHDSIDKATTLEDLKTIGAVIKEESAKLMPGDSAALRKAFGARKSALTPADTRKAA